MGQQLPRGWGRCKLSEISDLKSGVTKGQKYPATLKLRSVSYLRVANVQRGYLDLKDVRQIEVTERELEDLRLEPGDVLFNEGGDRDKLGRGWVWSGEIADCIHQNHVFRARLVSSKVLPHFLSLYANYCSQSYFLEQGKQTTNLASISLSKLGSLPVVVPPINEQRRIVAKLDVLLERCRSTADTLCCTLSCVDSYRRSMLGALFYQFFKSGNASIQLDATLPEGRVITYGIVQTGENRENGIPTVRCGDIKRFSINRNSLKKVSVEIERNYPRTRLRGGEVLLAIRGTVGAAAAVSKDMQGMNVSREIAVIPLRADFEPLFIVYLLASPFGAQFLKDRTKGVAQSGINISDLRTFPVPAISRAQQEEIVHRVESILAKADAIEKQVKEAQAQLKMFEQAILAKAFRGELVPQDPNDEPASVLLDRIRADREASPEKGTGKRGRSSKSKEAAG